LFGRKKFWDNFLTAQKLGTGAFAPVSIGPRRYCNDRAVTNRLPTTNLKQIVRHNIYETEELPHIHSRAKYS